MAIISDAPFSLVMKKQENCSSFTRRSFAQYEGLRGFVPATQNPGFIPTACGIRTGGGVNMVVVSAKVGAPKREKDAKKRVVITGMGMVSALGNDVDTFYDNLLAGQSGIGTIPIPVITTGFFADINMFPPTPPANAKSTLSILFDFMIDRSRVGVVVGTGVGGTTIFSDGVEALTKKGYKKMNPFFLYNIANTGSALLAIEAGLMGPNYSISTACASANHSLYSAANHIRKGEADIMLAGGTECPINPLSLGGFIACRALSQRNDDPQTASRPWDTQHVMDEGYGVLVMESMEHAIKQGASIIVE